MNKGLNHHQLVHDTYHELNNTLTSLYESTACHAESSDGDWRSKYVTDARPARSLWRQPHGYSSSGYDDLVGDGSDESGKTMDSRLPGQQSHQSVQPPVD